MSQEVKTVKSGKFAEYLHLIDLREFGARRILASFIAEFDDCSIILDCGSSLEVKRTWRYAKRNNIPLSSIKYLIPTHHHFDHSGGMWKLYEEIKKHNPDVKILTNLKTMELLNDFEHHLNRAKRTFQDFIGIMKPIDESAFKIIEPSSNFTPNPNSLDFIDTFTKDGSEIKLAIMKTPGHTPDHQCPLFVRDNEIEFIYLGEAAGNIYHSTKLITMPTSMPIYFNYNNFIESLKNLIRLKTPMKTGYTHFGVVNGKENIQYIMKEQESFIKDFRSKVIKYYNEQPKTEYVVKKLIPYFAARTDLRGVGADNFPLQNIVLGIVYGMMMDLGFRKD